MEIEHSDQIVLSVIRNLALSAPRHSRISSALRSWLDNHFHKLEAQWSPATMKIADDLTEMPLMGLKRRQMTRQQRNCRYADFFTAIVQDIDETLETIGVDELSVKPGVEALASNLELDGLQQEILFLLIAAMEDDDLETLMAKVIQASHGVDRGLALILGQREDAIFKAFREPSTGLVDLGVAAPGYQQNPVYKIAEILRQSVREAIQSDFTNTLHVERTLLGQPHEASIPYEGFNHVMQQRDMIIGILRGAINSKARGVNILIHGPAGVGKTELAKTVCGHLGISLYPVGEKTSQDGVERDRLGRLLMSQKLLGKRGLSALLFDEMEDVADDCFGDFGSLRPVASKIFLHRILETNQTPVIWIANSTHLFGSSIHRRMSYVAHIEVPDHKVRSAMFKAACDRQGLSVDGEQLESLAREYPVPPAIIESAARTANYAEGGAGCLKHVLASLSGASGFIEQRTASPSKKDKGPYDLSLVKVKDKSTDLQGLVGRLANSPTQSFSLCLSGPPGSGKTAFAKHLAAALGLPLIEKRASDILAPFVGQTEMAIADAFKESSRKEGLLFIDEADSLLGDRRCAIRSWEISQVNELLAQMQDHPYPIVAATNFMDHLDQASLRRFTFKVEFGFMSREQIKSAFNVFFDLNAPDGAETLELLTAGDFATVRTKARVLGHLEDPLKLLSYLSEESGAKVEYGGQRRRVGFGS